MDEFKFIFKSFLATLALVALMQIKVGGHTIEGRAYQILAHSQIAGFLNHVAKGAVQLGRQATSYLEQKINESRR